MARCKRGTAKKCRTVCSLPCSSANSKAGGGTGRRRVRNVVPVPVRNTKKKRRIIPTPVNSPQPQGNIRRIQPTTVNSPQPQGNIQSSSAPPPIGTGLRRFYTEYLDNLEKKAKTWDKDPKNRKVYRFKGRKK